VHHAIVNGTAQKKQALGRDSQPNLLPPTGTTASHTAAFGLPGDTNGRHEQKKASVS
jgi:hypothetical protein